MLEIPGYIHLVFILTTLLTYVLFIVANSVSPDKVLRRRSNMIALVLLMWLMFQSTLSLNKWYMDRNSMPPNMAFPLITSIVIISCLFLLRPGKRWIENTSIHMLTWIHIVRIPVELCLFWLAGSKQLPWSMTFHGMNYDIIFGITAPIMALLYFRYHKISAKGMIIWNILGLISVLLVVIRGIGAVPSPIQAWDFEQPNYAVLHFPFIWLPSFIVPIVVLAHLVAIRRFRKMQ
jgi:hypothetical protein